MEYAAAASTLARRQAIVAFMMPYMITFTILSILIYLASSIAMWNIFVKSGEKGWKGFVPFYNTYILFKISWDVKFFWVSLGLLVISLIAGNVRGGSVVILVLSIVVILAMVAWFVIYCIAMVKLSQSFGKGGGFAVGLILLNTIFLLILGFGQSEYFLAIGKDAKIVVNKDDFLNIKKLKSAAQNKSDKNTTTDASKNTKAKSTEDVKPTKKAASTTKPSDQKSAAKKTPDYIDPKEKIEF